MRLSSATVNVRISTRRRRIKPPSGLVDHVSRRQAAAIFGFASEFKVRQLEREGRLTPVRGAMSSAWYPIAQVRALARRLAAEAGLERGS